MMNQTSTETGQPYSIGLALSGGGAKGFVHVGILKALEEQGIRPGILAGVSAGSIVSVLYASGFTIGEILDMFGTPHISDYASFSIPKDGFFRLDGLEKLLKRNLRVKRIEDLPVPVVIGATDFDHGKAVKFEEGDIVDCVIASCAIPIVVQPKKINGVNYVDGGLLRNLPAWTIRDRCHTLIGANCVPIATGPHKPNLLSAAHRAFDLLVKYNTIADMDMCDIVISTEEAGSLSMLSIREQKKLYNIGYQKAKQIIEENKFLKDQKHTGHGR